MIDFRQVDQPISFFFLRHGESEANILKVMQGREDYPLSERGRLQARQAGEWLKRHPIGRVLSSPLSRCVSTAEIVAERLGTGPVEIREELIELDIGIFRGLSLAQCRERYPREWERFQRESWEAVPGAEKVSELLERAARLWRNLLEEARSDRRWPLCVTHSGILQWILKATVGQRQWMPLFPMSNCGISQLRIRNAWHQEWAMINYQAPDGQD